MWLTLIVYVVLWIGSIVYGILDANADYSKIKLKGNILDHSNEIYSRLIVFGIANIILIWFIPSWTFMLTWNVLSLATWAIVFEARINKHLKQSFLYTGTTAVWDKFFLKLPYGDIIKVLLKTVIFAVGLYMSFVLFMNF